MDKCHRGTVYRVIAGGRKSIPESLVLIDSDDRAHAATYGVPRGCNTFNTVPPIYTWIMTAALKLSRTSLNKNGGMYLRETLYAGLAGLQISTAKALIQVL